MECQKVKTAMEGVESPEREMKQRYCEKVQLYEAAPNNIALTIILVIK